MNIQSTYSDKEKAIFESALRLFDEYGIQAAPMSKVANEARVATGTVYHYFASKEELILALFQYCRVSTNQAILADDDTRHSYEARFHNVWHNLVDYYIRHPRIMSFLNQFYSSPYGKLISEAKICFQSEIMNFLKTGIREKQIKKLDLNILSVALIGTAMNLAQRQTLSKTCNHPEWGFGKKALESMAGILWDGIKQS